jgi:hypothetical protein
VIGGQVAGFTMVVGGEVEQVYVDAGPFDYAAAGDHGPIPVPSHRYVKEL